MAEDDFSHALIVHRATISGKTAAVRVTVFDAVISVRQHYGDDTSQTFRFDKGQWAKIVAFVGEHMGEKGA